MKISIDFKLPINRLKPIDRLKPMDDQSSIIKILQKARLPIDYRKQSITNPLIGHWLEKVIDCIEWKSLDDFTKRAKYFFLGGFGWGKLAEMWKAQSAYTVYKINLDVWISTAGIN